MSNKYPKGHSMNNPDIGTESAPGLKGRKKKKPNPPQVAMGQNKVQYAAGGKKMKMASYYAGGGTVYTGR